MKNVRHKLISEMISGGSVKSQAEIVERLSKRGFAVTQTSVSRDLEALHARKAKGSYQLAPQNDMGGVFGMVSIAKSGNNLIVARCGSGLASALAVHLDAMKLDQVVGTIAGDDTVFIAVGSGPSQRSVFKKLKENFGG